MVDCAILLLAAGRVNWINAWIYIGLILAYELVCTVSLILLNPVVLNTRGKFAKKGTKTFDYWYMVLYMLFSLAGLIVMGFDAGRYRWSVVPWGVVLAGIVMILPAFVLGICAMAVNPYFECTVRIQKDREHQVVTAGPYRWMRHPGYAGQILSWLATPLILGSWWGVLPSTLVIVLIVIRTILEDRTLLKELPGYGEYVRTTRYRLLPPIW